jgi:peptide/nickel transport system permease protein
VIGDRRVVPYAAPAVLSQITSTLRPKGPLWVGAGIVALVLMLAIGASAVAPYDPLSTGPAVLEGPSIAHLMGTDALGRDLFSRILFGARLSLGAALLTLLLIVTAGVSLGLVAGYDGRWIDTILMRFADVVLSIPSLILVLAIVGLFRPGLLSLVLALSGVWWVRYARLTRGLVLSSRERVCVEAARALGAGDMRILIRHVLPDVLRSIIVLATLDVGNVVLAVSALTFLGMGTQPPTPEWGAMINEGKDYLFVAPHVMLFPGLTLSLTVLGFNLLGDGFVDSIGAKESRLP